MKEPGFDLVSPRAVQVEFGRLDSRKGSMMAKKKAQQIEAQRATQKQPVLTDSLKEIVLTAPLKEILLTASLKEIVTEPLRETVSSASRMDSWRPCHQAMDAGSASQKAALKDRM